jgi:hypothetical protein
MQNDKTFTVVRPKTKNCKELFSIVLPEQIIIGLRGKTKETVISELLDMLATQGKLLNRDLALKDLFGS